MRLTDKELEFLRAAIRKHKMMELWADGLAVDPAEDKASRARRRALEAKNKYVRMMASQTNDGSEAYREWAVHKALGLRQKPTPVGFKIRDFSRRRNRGMA